MFGAVPWVAEAPSIVAAISVSVRLAQSSDVSGPPAVSHELCHPRGRETSRTRDPRSRLPAARAALEVRTAASWACKRNGAPTTLARARPSTLLNPEFAAEESAGVAGRHRGGRCDASRKPSPFRAKTPVPSLQDCGRSSHFVPPQASPSSQPGFSLGMPGLRCLAHLQVQRLRPLASRGL